MKKKLLIFILIFGIISMGSVYANAAEPPSIVVYIKHAPETLNMYIFSDGYKHTFDRYDQLGSTYYCMYDLELKRDTVYQLCVENDEQKYAVELPPDLNLYNNTFNLNYLTGELRKGKGWLRSFILIGLRVVITLVLEGFVFALFRFTENRSWLLFLLFNLITQMWLSIWINSVSPRLGYLFFSLAFYEVLIMGAELLMFNLFIKEHPKWYISLYVVTANLVSLFIGGYLILKLPI